MWLIARRSVADGWGRLAATLLAAVLSIGMIAGGLQFTLRAQEALSGSDASEYARADVLVLGGTTDPESTRATREGKVAPNQVAGLPGVAAVAGDAQLPVTAGGPDGEPIPPPAWAGTLLRPWTPETALNPYRLESGRAPAADGEVAVTRHAARGGDLETGDPLRVALPKRTREMKVVGIVTVQGRDAVADGNLVLAPPETVREAAGLPAGTWHGVWVKAAPGVEAARLSEDLNRALSGDDVTVRTAADVRAEQSGTVRGDASMMSGIIAMLSLIGVFVGLFVVANTFGTLVRQRTRRLALLGAIGATPRQIKRLIKLEALALGIVASIGGLLLGYPVSSLLAALLAEDGFDITATGPQYGWIALVAPAAAGILVIQLSAWRAASKAARISPMEALRSTGSGTAGRRWPRVLGALALFGCSWIFLGSAFGTQDGQPPGVQRATSICALILIGSMINVIALSVLAPFFVGPLGGLVGRVGTVASGEAGRLARATISRSPRRVSAAASSLMLGVVLVGTPSLVALSAEARYDEAGRQVMLAERAITSTGSDEAERASLPRDTAERAAAARGVTSAAALTATDAELVEPPPQGPAGLPLPLRVTGADQAALPSVADLGGDLRPLRPGEIGLTSGIMKMRDIEKGQRIVVRTESGRVALTVAGAYHDPSHLFADQALVSPATMDRLDPGAAPQAVLVRGGTEDGLTRALAGVPGAEVQDRSAYIETVVDSTTNGRTVIYGFIAMSLVLALFGLATTISMSVAERTREFGLLGAVGATAAQIRSVVRWEATTVVLLGGLLGSGIAVGAVSMMRLATGSTFIDPVPPWWLFVVVLAGAAAVTLATSALPGRRAADVPILEATRAE
ncbi:FtsX-like permease family protein [Actinomadura sp. 7K507]|uniref:FtsX-like permease family protein n=1 Tax=Actinomadura sp. 7K507 TaxID=2530365 RepID=UPI0010521BAD|nr:FtsX-like permease family protein [Actinomadura sp. 7K507]TDC91259.1 FtsX-like permease family protein [Actinomadura sp. 7K507]